MVLNMNAFTMSYVFRTYDSLQHGTNVGGYYLCLFEAVVLYICDCISSLRTKFDVVCLHRVIRDKRLAGGAPLHTNGWRADWVG